MKCSKALREIGHKIKQEYIFCSWEEMLQRTELPKIIEKHNLNAFDVEVIRKGFNGDPCPCECPSPDDRFPFGKPRIHGKRFRDVHPDYYNWFLKQEWKDKWPQVIAYCVYYRDGLKAFSIQKLDEEKENQSLIDDLTKLD
jgi:hypothetical protein